VRMGLTVEGPGSTGNWDVYEDSVLDVPIAIGNR